jgi:hypothetical protein
MHNIIVYLFIFFVHLLPDMFRQVTMPLSEGYIKLHNMCMKCEYKMLKNVKC